jgi:hypothetical protein
MINDSDRDQTPPETPTPANEIAIDNKLIWIFRRIWYGKDLKRPTYIIASTVFLRMLGVIYLIAFVSLWTQISGLVGDHGLLPVENFLDAVKQHFAARDPPASPIWNVPTLLWISPHDGLLHLICGAGTLFSLMLMAGMLPLPTLAMLWVCYLSLFYAGQDFLSFQWDILLLETGFLAMFVAPAKWRSRFLADRHPSRLAIWLVWWLLFRLMLESGAVKLTWNDGQVGPDGLPLANTWESLTALDYHYWTQPLPIWTSWYAAQLPAWFQKLSVVGVFVIELALPWFIFGPRVLKYTAFAGFSLLMLLIGATGNYNFFNLLTLTLALTLLDDGIWPPFLRRRIRGERRPGSHLFRRLRNIVLVPFAGLAILAGAIQIKEAVFPPRFRQASLESKLHVGQFLLVNDYGLFRRMTETRPEIVIEGSADGNVWKPYEFRWKPGDLARPPGFNTPHQPRLDWQMWFEALQLERAYCLTGTMDPQYMSLWFQSLIQHLLKGDPVVVGLLAKNPFPDAPPKFIRVGLYQYRFTDPSERAATGDWWHREQVAVLPSFSLPNQQPARGQ